MNLSSNHRRVLGVRLSQVEERLGEIQRLLTQGAEEGVFSRRVDGIRPGQKRELSALLSEARQELRGIGQTLNLDVREESSRNLVQTLLAFTWSDLEDTRPQKLAGYGRMSPEVASFVSPRVQRLIDIVKKMSLVLASDNDE